MTAERRRIPELDGYRVLLIFIVSWYHIWQQSWWTPRVGSVSLDFLVRSGYMHVDGMILLSAFLLFMPWTRSLLNGDPLPDTTAFYRKRFARIYPSHVFIMLVMLLAVALPWGLYASPAFLVKDVATHLTFTYNLFADTYLSTQLGVAAWTLAVEVQLYLLFPWIAKAVVRHPSRLLWLVLCGWGWRAWCILSLKDYNLVVNQMPAFLDVVALGMLLAIVSAWLDAHRPARGRLLTEVGATLLAAAAIWLLVLLLKRQASCGTYTLIQKGQMIRRFPLALIYGLLILALPRMLKPLRFLFGNRVMGWLAAISMNYYLIHASVAVHLKRLGIPPPVAEEPFRHSEMPWQWQYTFLSFGLSLLLAAAITFLVEKPAAALLLRRFADEDRRAAFRAEKRKESRNDPCKPTV